MSQKKIFLKSEGDSWFKRNFIRSQFKQQDSTKLLIKWLKGFKKNINNILEIGSSDGKVLTHLCKNLNAKGLGIDPSTLAVRRGFTSFKKSKSTKLSLKVGTSDSLPVKTNSIDLVHFGFCLVWIDRSDLFKTIAEADRVCKTGGFISIVDFDPSFNHKVKYHHRGGIFTYKSDYSEIFLSSRHYKLVNCYSFSHRDFNFVKDYKKRVKLTLLYKEEDPYIKI